MAAVVAAPSTCEESDEDASGEDDGEDVFDFDEESVDGDGGGTTSAASSTGEASPPPKHTSAASRGIPSAAPSAIDSIWRSSPTAKGAPQAANSGTHLSSPSQLTTSL